jgi:hypothetical protein
MIIRRGLAAAGLLTAIGVAPMADAATTTGTQVGSACHSVYDANSGYGSNIYHNGNGVISTDTTLGKFFVCPIQRVNGLSTTGLAGAWVDMYEANTTTQSWCQLNAFDEFGNQVGGNPVTYSGGTGQRELSLGSLATSDQWGFYSIFCAILPRPANSVAAQIYAYEWQER